VVGTVATRSVAAATAAAAVSVAMSVLCVGAVGAGKGTGSARRTLRRGEARDRDVRGNGVRQRGRGGGGRGVATYHTPSIPKSRGRLAPRQIAVASTPRASQRRSGKRRKARSLSRKWQKIVAAAATAAARVLWHQRGPPPLGKKRSSRTPHRSSTYQPYVRVRDLQRDRPTDRRANGRKKRCNEDGTRPGRTTRIQREDGECRTTTAINA
jgi:hypothetical protein